MTGKEIKLGFSIWPTGRHASSWRLPEAHAHGSVDPDFLRSVAQKLERAKFDYFFIGNQLSSDPAAQRSSHIGVFKIDAFSLASYVAAVTSKIGIVATVNANFIDPYNTARSAATLDHLSKGRAALNVITSTGAGDNYSQEANFTSDYGRTEELVEVIQALWDSWEDGAVVADKAGGQWVDPDRAHALNHVGRHFQVAGPLNIPRPPQGQLPIVHAGASENSKEFGAKFADVRFSPFVDIEWNRAYYADVKSRLAKYGRNEADQYVLPGITFYVAETSREAHAKFREVQNLSVNAYDEAAVSARLNTDLTGVPASSRLADVVDIASLETVFDLSAAGVFAARNTPTLIDLAFRSFGDDNITLLDFFQFLGNGPYPQSPVVGSATEVADWLENQVDGKVLDGAVVFPAFLPGSLDSFTELVVPELRRRGRVRSEYTTSTFREHFALPVPRNRFALTEAVSA
jgi:FMN-dependent oxidoreductase (nitrilotriacetate monooxygenase family)